MFFVDTNIFVYAQDGSDPHKAGIARQLLRQLAKDRSGCISTQVVQEFCNVALKKSAVPLRATDVSQIVDVLLLPMLAHTPDGAFYARTLRTYDQYSLSFYDAAIVQAATDMGCPVIYSEDMQDGARYGQTLIVNPFRTDSPR